MNNGNILEKFGASNIVCSNIYFKIFDIQEVIGILSEKVSIFLQYYTLAMHIIVGRGPPDKRQSVRNSLRKGCKSNVDGKIV